MTSLFVWLDRFQLSPRSQRVLTEALLDWRHEAAAPTFMRALAAHVKSTFGLARAILTLIMMSSWEVVSPSWLLRFLICWIVASAVMNLYGFWPGTSFATGVMHFSAALLGSVWLASFYTVLTAPKSVPLPRVGLVLLSVLSVVIAAEWIFPATIAFEITSSGGVPPAKYVSYTMVQYVNHFACIVASVMLASAMRSRQTSRRWGVSFPLVLMFGLGSLINVVTQLLIPLFGTPPRMLNAWVMVVVIIAYWFKLVSSRERTPAAG